MFLRKFAISSLCLASLFLGQIAVAQAKPDKGEASPQATKGALDGTWLGTLHDGNEELHLRLTITSDDAGAPHYTLYSLDQGARPIPCRNIKQDGTSLSFDVPAVKGHWAGKISANNKVLDGTWTQDKTLPLIFKRS